MKTSPEGIALMHHFEACKLTAYPDPATNGPPWTIGWGHTGPEVVPGLQWTQEQADKAFADRLANEFEPGVLALCVREPSQLQFDALVCFAYNVGLRNLKTSTLIRKFNAGDILGAADEFPRWNKAAGKVMRGLSRRRNAERALFLGSPAKEAIDYGLRAA
jgi:lysozyme